MDDPSDRQLKKLQVRLGAVAAEITHVQLNIRGPAPKWAPAINAWRCGSDFVVCVDLAGVESDRVHLEAESQRIRISGTRPPPEPPCGRASPQLLAMEIDYGPFERILELPSEIDQDQIAAEQIDGLLWIRLPKRGQG